MRIKFLASHCLLVITFLFGLFSLRGSVMAQTSDNPWPMIGHDPQRSSWSNEQIGSVNTVEWYRPLEAYIDQKVQLITANNLIYVSTSKGLVVLRADSGELAWRYDTQLPLGHSPTIDLTTNTLYVGGYDKKLYAFNALTGSKLWEFSNAKAGFDTNPLVIEGKVILGNRDGYMYAVGAQGSSQSGQEVWKYQTGGAINLSAAYKNGVVYFASNDQYAYALRASDGSLVWKSPQKLIGDGFHSYWPVIYRNKVIFTTAQVKKYFVNCVFEIDQNLDVGLPGTVMPAQPWSNGHPVLNATKITQCLEQNPTPDTYKYRPWLREFLVLDQANGQEFTYDSDNDGYPEYAPFGFWDTGSGNRIPGIVNPNDNLLYAGNLHRSGGDPKGMVYTWNLDFPHLLGMIGSDANGSMAGAWAAMAEPQALSGGGSYFYRSLCCDRIGSRHSVASGGSANYWSYNLSTLAPGYDEMWTIPARSISRHIGWYKGTLTSTENGTYHNHGDQNPLIPYQGKVYVHRSNAIIAFGSGTPRGKLAAIPIVSVNQPQADVPLDELRNRLENQVAKMLAVSGHLRPGFLTTRMFNNSDFFPDYYANPGDTLYTLSAAYPHLSDATKRLVQDYLANRLIPDYFNPTMYATMGWLNNAPREAMPPNPEIESQYASKAKSLTESIFAPAYPQINFYAMYLYAKNVPNVNALTLYNLAKPKLNLNPNTTYFADFPFIHNGWISGYIGFLKLQELAGMTQTDATLRQQVITQRDSLLNSRYTGFNKNSPWTAQLIYYRKTTDLSRNFLLMVPELADYFRQNILNQVNQAMTEYEYIAPFWFAGKYESAVGEHIFQNLYTPSALFKVKAYIQQAPREELIKYLDVPQFDRGDLFYIQNLVTTIEAPLSGNPPPTATPTPTPTPRPGDANSDGRVDGIDYVIWFSHYNQTTSNGFRDGDFDQNGRVDGLDYMIWNTHYGQ